jgi:hypothetical protein
MPTTYASAFSRHDLPEAWRRFSPERGSRECRMHAAPAVSRAICAKQMRTRAYRFSGGNPAFPAQWLYGLLRALPGDEFLFVTVTSGLRLVLSPVGPTRLRRLDISNGCQNHTTSPYAATFDRHSDRRRADRNSGEGASAVRPRRRKITHGRTRPATTIAPDAAASTASNPASVTIAIRPSRRDGWAQ